MYTWGPDDPSSSAEPTHALPLMTKSATISTFFPSHLNNMSKQKQQNIVTERLSD